MSLAGMGFGSKHDFAPPTILLGLLLCLGCGVSFVGGIQYSPVDGCSAVSCNFGLLMGEDECMPSTPPVSFMVQEKTNISH